MIWVVDTCVVLDVLENDADFGLRSARLLEERLAEGLGICPVTQVELAPAFAGDMDEQTRFLDQAGIDYFAAWTVADTAAAHQAWHFEPLTVHWTVLGGFQVNVSPPLSGRRRIGTGSRRPSGPGLYGVRK